MDRILAYVVVIVVCLVLTSCAPHAPPEEVIRTLCAEHVGAAPVPGVSGSRSTIAENTVVEVVKISRKGMGESKHTRGIPDKKLVYPVSCLLKTRTDGESTGTVSVFLYFYKDDNGNWVVRSRT